MTLQTDLHPGPAVLLDCSGSGRSRPGRGKQGKPVSKVSLTGSHGYSSSALGTLFQPDMAWSLAAGFFQPLFDAGRLKAGQRAAEARYARGVAEYTKTLCPQMTAGILLA